MYRVQTAMNRNYKINPWDYFEYKNKFLEKITDDCQSLNWVGIEEEYYAWLKECFNGTKRIDELNRDFNRIKIALEDYLKEEINDKLKDISCINIAKKIFSEINKNDLTEKAKSTDFNSSPDSILFLNFNYTSTDQYYSKIDKNRYPSIKLPQTDESIYIHGKLGDADNPIIFGYGDEIDENYKLIENLNDNRYLENIKSIKYLETNNYKRLLNFINSDNYQIFIFGHSCGNSDRTLLKTLFEHDNCASIKVFYHKQEDGTDNYSNVVRNISRHFTDKAVMRDKVVNKTFCEQLR
jgi:hypothetical protein